MPKSIRIAGRQEVGPAARATVSKTVAKSAPNNVPEDVPKTGPGGPALKVCSLRPRKRWRTL